MAGTGLDVEETDDEVIVRADAPGFGPGDIDVQVSDNTLKVAAERKAEGKGKGLNVERRLFRTVTLPAGVDPGRVEATYRHGVLELRLPKTEQAKWRKIEVKAS
jgi:HSP20 family protein